MGHQRTDREVAKDAERFNTTYRDLKAFLRSRGIRNVHTSRKAQAAIAIASTRPLTEKQKGGR